MSRIYITILLVYHRLWCAIAPGELWAVHVQEKDVPFVCMCGGLIVIVKDGDRENEHVHGFAQ